ncbi:LPS-assembly lipoprotein LptE [Vreelandella jeotgali]|uniref:LPS-assembly lipoprotein LptE n=1 Tax=Vreelandella jeotgali TaxID=553386 RepID=UPI00034B0B0D|nr:hypothetical protein [Halomonas jeotgali]
MSTERSRTAPRLQRRTFLRHAALGAALIPLAGTLLSGCGFHLRGRDGLPDLPALALEGDTQSALGQALAQRLERRSGGIREDAAWQLTLGGVRVHNRRLGGNGRGSREHEFTLEADVSVQQRSTGAYLWNREAFSETLRRRINNDDSLNRDVLVKESRQQLGERLAGRIMERLGSIEALQ